MKFNFLGIFLCIAVVSLSSCKKDKTDEEKIIGSWLLTDYCELDDDNQPINCDPNPNDVCVGAPEESNYVVFKDDNTIKSNYRECSAEDLYVCTSYTDGTWQMEDDIIFLSFTKDYFCPTDTFSLDEELVQLNVVSFEDGILVVKEFSSPEEGYQLTFTKQ